MRSLRYARLVAAPSTAQSVGECGSLTNARASEGALSPEVV